MLAPSSLGGSWFPNSSLDIVPKPLPKRDVEGLYSLIGADPDSTDTEVRAAAMRRLRETHPDNGGDSSEFMEVHRAYEVLSDPEKRREYDSREAPRAVLRLRRSARKARPDAIRVKPRRSSPGWFKEPRDVLTDGDVESVGRWLSLVLGAFQSAGASVEVKVGISKSVPAGCYSVESGVAVIGAGTVPDELHADAYVLMRLSEEGKEKMTVDFNPFAEAQKVASSGGGGRTSFFSIKDGETKSIRPVTPLLPMYVFAHECGLHDYEVLVQQYDEHGATCPTCGKPLEQKDIVARMQPLVGAYVHRFIKTADGNRSNFVCLEHQYNVDTGLVDGDGNAVPGHPNGAPKYQCPICHCMESWNLRKDGVPRSPSFRGYGAAIERDVTTQIVTGPNGLPVPQVTGSEDVEDPNEPGKPLVEIVDMGFQSFWSKFSEFDPSFQTSICYYDWNIGRTGSSIDTTYSVSNASGRENPTFLDYAKYRDLVPDITGFLKNIGTPKFYGDKGYPVLGYQDDGSVSGGAANAQAAFAQAQAPAQQYAQPSPAQQPYPQPYPAAQQAQPQGQTYDFEAIRNQINQNAPQQQ